MDLKYQILLFYKYVHIADTESVRVVLENLCKQRHLTGRLIVASEGLNCTLEGTVADTEDFIAALEHDERFRTIHFKKSVGTGHAFPRLSVRVRKEIVTGNLGVCDIDPNTVTGKRLLPETLHQWLTSDKEFYIVDMRNVYEHEAGHFAGSITPAMENFRDLPEVTKSIAHLKQKTVVTVCTGGIRCEKASGYLITQGFNDVYQLDGGIVSYMEKYPNEHFEGKLYVFDRRVLMMPARPLEAGGGFYTDDPRHKVIGTCKSCGASSERFVNCDNAWCGKHYILCRPCEEKQVAAHGVHTCPQGCVLRRPNKIHSPWQYLAARIKTLFNL